MQKYDLLKKSYVFKKFYNNSLGAATIRHLRCVYTICCNMRRALLIVFKNYICVISQSKCQLTKYFYGNSSDDMFGAGVKNVNFLLRCLCPQGKPKRPILPLSQLAFTSIILGSNSNTVWWSVSRSSVLTNIRDLFLPLWSASVVF